MEINDRVFVYSDVPIRMSYPLKPFATLPAQLEPSSMTRSSCKTRGVIIPN